MHHQFAFLLPVIGGLVAAAAVGTCVHGESPDAEKSRESQPSRVVSHMIATYGVTLEVACPQKMASGSPNYVTMLVRNNSERTVEFVPVAPQGLGLGFEVKRQGKPVGVTSFGRTYLVQEGESRNGTPIRLKRGQERRVVVNLTRYYDLSLTGRYDIVVSWVGKFVGSDAPLQIRTRPMEFEVVVKRGESVSLP